MAKIHVEIPRYVAERVQAALETIERELPRGHRIVALTTEAWGPRTRSLGRHKEWVLTIEVEPAPEEPAPG